VRVLEAAKVSIEAFGQPVNISREPALVLASPATSIAARRFARRASVPEIEAA
jgi:hypothetical protein